MKKIIIFTVLLLFILSPIVFAKESYTISVNKGRAERDKGTRNWVTIDDFLYYSFYDNKDGKLVKDGKNYTLSLPANKYTSKQGGATGTISVPKITFKGTGATDKNGQMVIEMKGTIDGTITSKTVGENVTKNYKFNVTALKLTIEYTEKLVKDGKIESDAKLTYSYTSSNDVKEPAYSGDDLRSTNISKITISGLDGAKEKVTATNVATKTAAKNTVNKTSSNNSTNSVASTNTAKEDNNINIVEDIITEETTENKNGFPLGAVVGTVGTIAIIGGSVVAINRFGMSKTKTVKDNVTGEEKNYNYDEETGEYVSEDGRTILNTEIMDEVAKQQIKDKEFMDREHQKLINRQTAEDDLNRKMVEENKQTERELKREEYIDKVASRNGIRSTNKDDIKKELKDIQEHNEAKSASYKKQGEIWDAATKTAEVVEEAADIAITVGETVVPGGKVVSATYKATKSVASTAAKHGMDKGKLAGAAIKGLTDAGTTFIGNGVYKAGTTIAGEVAGDVTEAIIEGKNAGEVWDAAKDASVRGTGKAIVTATGDAAGDIVGNEAANVGSYLYQKHVVDQKMDEAIKKSKENKK